MRVSSSSSWERGLSQNAPRKSPSIPSPDLDDDLVQRLVDANDIGDVLRKIRDQHSAFIRTAVDRRVAPSPSAHRPLVPHVLMSPVLAEGPAQRPANTSVLSPSLNDDENQNEEVIPRFNDRVEVSVKENVASRRRDEEKAEHRHRYEQPPAPGTPTPSSVVGHEDLDSSTLQLPAQGSNKENGHRGLQKPIHRQILLGAVSGGEADAEAFSRSRGQQRDASPHSAVQHAIVSQPSSLSHRTPEKHRAEGHSVASPTSGGGLQNVSRRNNQRQLQLKKNYEQLVKASLSPPAGFAKAADRAMVTTFSIDGLVPPEQAISGSKPEDDPFVVRAPFGYAQPSAHQGSSSQYHKSRDLFEGAEGDALSNDDDADDEEAEGSSQSDSPEGPTEGPVVVERQQHLRPPANPKNMKLRGTHYAATPAGGAAANEGGTGGLGAPSAIHHTRQVTGTSVGDYFEAASVLSSDGPLLQAQQQPRQAGGTATASSKHKQPGNINIAAKQAPAEGAAPAPVGTPRGGNAVSSATSGKKKDGHSSPSPLNSVPQAAAGSKAHARTAPPPKGGATSSGKQQQMTLAPSAAKDRTTSGSAGGNQSSGGGGGGGLAAEAASNSRPHRGEAKAAPPLSPAGGLKPSKLAEAPHSLSPVRTDDDNSGSYSSGFYTSYSYSSYSDYSGSTSEVDEEDDGQPQQEVRQRPVTTNAATAAATTSKPQLPLDRKPAQNPSSKNIKVQTAAYQPPRPLAVPAAARAGLPTSSGRAESQLALRGQHAQHAPARHAASSGTLQSSVQAGAPSVKQQLQPRKGLQASASAVISAVPPSQLHLYKTPGVHQQGAHQPPALRPAPQSRSSTPTSAQDYPLSPGASQPPPRTVMLHPYLPYAIPVEDFEKQKQQALQAAAAATTNRSASQSSQQRGASVPPRFVAPSAEQDFPRYTWKTSESGYVAPAPLASRRFEPPESVPEVGRSSSQTSAVENPVPLPTTRAESFSTTPSATRFSIPA
jgi:hypothetical protein